METLFSWTQSMFFFSCTMNHLKHLTKQVLQGVSVDKGPYNPTPARKPHSYKTNVGGLCHG